MNTGWRLRRGRPSSGWTGACAAKVVVVGDDTVQVTLDERDRILGEPVTRTYRLRPFVYV